MMEKKKGFTLIELLIVVAIIAILAAIAVPNFLEAQVRSKVSRDKADMRSMATAMEAYVVDTNAYPPCNSFGAPVWLSGSPWNVLENLSTPVAYMTSAITRDPFSIKGRYSASDAQVMQTVPVTVVGPTDVVYQLNCLVYQSWSSNNRATPGEKARGWLLHSAGPDSNYYNLGGVLANDGVDKLGYLLDMMYDPTNGTTSRGSIWRAGGMTDGSSTYKAASGLVKAIQIANK